LPSAVGNRPFVEKVKAILGFRAKGRKITRSGERYQVWQAAARYNEVLGSENTYPWDLNL
jgi:hypothetical protein